MVGYSQLSFGEQDGDYAIEDYMTVRLVQTTFMLIGCFKLAFLISWWSYVSCTCVHACCVVLCNITEFWESRSAHYTSGWSYTCGSCAGRVSIRLWKLCRPCLHTPVEVVQAVSQHTCGSCAGRVSIHLWKLCRPCLHTAAIKQEVANDVNIVVQLEQ